MRRRSKVKCIKYRRKNTVVEEKISKEEKRKISCLEYKTEKKSCGKIRK